MESLLLQNLLNKNKQLPYRKSISKDTKNQE